MLCFAFTLRNGFGLHKQQSMLQLDNNPYTKRKLAKSLTLSVSNVFLSQEIYSKFQQLFKNLICRIESILRNLGLRCRQNQENLMTISVKDFNERWYIWWERKTTNLKRTSLLSSGASIASLFLNLLHYQSNDTKVWK